MLDTLKILLHQGKQYIPDVTKAKVPGIFRGRPVISEDKSADNQSICDVCPTHALFEKEGKLQLDLGRCAFCGECERCFPNKIHFTQDYKLATNKRENLIVKEGEDKPIVFDKNAVRPEVKKLFGKSLKLRQVSAAGDNSGEWELGATGNVNFDMGRFGFEFVASPRHADGVVITGPISSNMAEALDICYNSVPDPKIVIVCGSEACSGGLYASSRAVDRSFLERYKVDLWLPGAPTHPMTFIDGVMNMLKLKTR